jgi:hypothetical protein
MEAATLTKSQARKAFNTYLRILEKENNGKHFPPNHADIEHSALLNRLLDGKDALPEPPPRMFSYPNYELVETGIYYPHEAGESQSQPGKVFIDQSIWNVVKVIPIENEGLNHYFVQWEEQKTVYSLTWEKESREITTSEGTPGKFRKEKRDGWVLRKVQ